MKTKANETDITNVLIGLFVVLLGLLIIITTNSFLSKQISTSSRASSPTNQVKPKYTNPIIGGQLAVDNEFPFYVVLLNPEGWIYCGGALISEEWVITAAHCRLEKLTPESIGAIVGLNHLDKNMRALHYSKIDNIIPFDSTNSPKNTGSWIDRTFNRGYYYDFALFHLKSKATGIPTISFLDYDSLRKNFIKKEIVGKKGLIMGFGTTKADFNVPTPTPIYSVFSSDLLKVEINIVGYDKLQYLNAITIQENGKKTGAGDSGGPLLYNYNNNLYILGVLSTGEQKTNGESHYTSIKEFATWIKEKTGITPNSGTYQKPSPNVTPAWPTQYPIPICAQFYTELDCLTKLKMCKWINKKCDNEPNRLK